MQERQRKQPKASEATLRMLGSIGYNGIEYPPEVEKIILEVAKREKGDKKPPADDLIQAARIRVWKALPTYDPAKGRLNKFVTRHAIGAMRDLARQKLAEDGMPRSLFPLWTKVNTFRDNHGGKMPSLEDCHDVKLGQYELPPTAEQLNQVLTFVSGGCQSLDALTEASVQKDTPEASRAAGLLQRIPSGKPADELAFSKIQAKELASVFQRALSTKAISNKEAAVLTLHHGLFGETPTTFKETGKKLGFTESRAVQVKYSAEAKLGWFMLTGKKLPLLSEVRDRSESSALEEKIYHHLGFDRFPFGSASKETILKKISAALDSIKPNQQNYLAEAFKLEVKQQHKHKYAFHILVRGLLPALHRLKNE